MQDLCKGSLQRKVSLIEPGNPKGIFGETQKRVEKVFRGDANIITLAISRTEMAESSSIIQLSAWNLNAKTKVPKEALKNMPLQNRV